MILLTGVTGFIGKHLLEGLVREYGVEQVLALSSVPAEGRRYILHNGYRFDDDYFVKSGYASVHTIIHAGSFTPKSGSQANNWLECNNNIFTTERLLKADFPNLERIIYLSTIDVYGNDEVVSETSVIQPLSLYGQSKVYCERMVAAYASGTNLISQVLRIGHVYGPGEEAYQKVIPVTIRKLLAGEPIEIWGTGNEIRSFIYIDDIVRAILASVHLKKDVGPVNLVSGHSITIREVVDKLVGFSQREVAVKIVPSGVPSRDLVYNNAMMKTWLLKDEMELDKGLLAEFEYMKQLPR